MPWNLIDGVLFEFVDFTLDTSNSFWIISKLNSWPFNISFHCLHHFSIKVMPYIRFCPILDLTDMRVQTVPLPLGGFSSIFLLDITHIHLIPVYKHKIWSAGLCEPYLMLLSRHVVNMQWWRVFVTLSNDDLVLVDVWKSPSMTIVWSGGKASLSTDGWVCMMCDLNTHADIALHSMFVGHA